MNQEEKIKGIFLPEAREHLATLLLGLSNINTTVADYESSQKIFRATFCLKGSSDVLGFHDVKRIVYGLEQCFKKVRDEHLLIDLPIQLQFTAVCQILVELFTEIAQTNYGQLSETDRAIAPESLILLQQLKASINQLCQASERNK